MIGDARCDVEGKVEGDDNVAGLRNPGMVFRTIRKVIDIVAGL